VSFCDHRHSGAQRSTIHLAFRLCVSIDMGFSCQCCVWLESPHAQEVAGPAKEWFESANNQWLEPLRLSEHNFSKGQRKRHLLFCLSNHNVYAQQQRAFNSLDAARDYLSNQSLQTYPEASVATPALASLSASSSLVSSSSSNSSLESNAEIVASNVANAVAVSVSVTSVLRPRPIAFAEWAAAV
jgi:hypothetical protein